MDIYPDTKIKVDDLKEALSDPDYRGQNFVVDSRIHYEGPVAKRKCTNPYCLVILLALIVTVAFSATYAVNNQQVEIVMDGVDADGRLCGYD